MTTDELEEKLEAGTETQNVEFKESCSWDVRSFAKDILALSNVQDGGHIIIGLREESEKYVRQGVESAHKGTYRIDVMKDQMAAFADPHTNFFVEFPPDRGGLVYAVIHVLEFDEVPVICRKDSDDTRAGVLYYRNRNRRVESAHVSNSFDMRDIIERASVRMMRRMKKLGLIVEGPDGRMVEHSVERRLNDELKNL